MPATTGQSTPAQEAGRPQPQTTVQPAGGPFIRHAQSGRFRQYDLTGQAFSANINQPLTAIPGYLRTLRLRTVATGGSTSANVSTTADAPASVYSLIQFYDAFGTPLLIGDGYSMAYVVGKYGGQFYSGGNEQKSAPTYSAIATASGASAGNFNFPTVLPVEIVKGIGTISMANAALLPKLQLSLGASTAIYASAGAAPVVPTLEVRVDADGYWLPDQPVAPPGLGTTCQWVLNQGNPTVASSGTTIVTLPRQGGYLTGIIPIFRDSTSARVDAYGSQIQFYVDGVPVIDTTFNDLKDDITNQFGLSTNTLTGGMTRDTGVLPITRKTSLGREIFGLLDTGEEWLSTSPGTSISIGCAPWGGFANTPRTLNVVAGQVVAAGALVTGLPEA